VPFPAAGGIVSVLRTNARTSRPQQMAMGAAVGMRMDVASLAVNELATHRSRVCRARIVSDRPNPLTGACDGPARKPP
jgi:hypothetical protein